MADYNISMNSKVRSFCHHLACAIGVIVKSSFRTFRSLRNSIPKKVLIIGSCIAAIVVIVIEGRIFRKPEEVSASEKHEVWKNPTEIDFDHKFVGSYREKFNDLNELHITAAKKWGVAPDQVEELIAQESERLRRLEDTPTLKISSLRHSEPYLVPFAYNLITDISRDFAKILQQKGVPPHRLIGTSFTRTMQQRNDLNKVNTNSSQNSAHCYGTTFDISWSKYDPLGKDTVSDAILKKLLAIVLEQYRTAGRCYIKHERKQACFHITAIGFEQDIEPISTK